MQLHSRLQRQCAHVDNTRLQKQSTKDALFPVCIIFGEHQLVTQATTLSKVKHISEILYCTY